MSEKRTKMRPEQRALLIVIILFISITSGLIGLVIWAINSDDSDSAATVRDIIGIQSEEIVVEAPEPPKEVVEVMPEPEPPMVEPTPEPEEPLKVTFSELASKSRYWPRQLILQTENRIEILFNGTSFGHLDFIPGSVINVYDISDPELISGTISTMDINITIPATHTNLEEWFADFYEGKLELIPLTGESAQPVLAENTDDFPKKSFMSDFKKWCYLYYESIDIEVTKDTLIFRWQMMDSGPVNYRSEARKIAYNYLNLQKQSGGGDNWAACEIRHPETDLVLGRASVFVPDI